MSKLINQLCLHTIALAFDRNSLLTLKTHTWFTEYSFLIPLTFSYSKVLEYLQTRALEYGPNMPPVDPARSPTDIIIGALCPDGRKPPALLGEDKISEVTPGGARITEVTPGISKEEPPSPPVGKFPIPSS